MVDPGNQIFDFVFGGFSGIIGGSPQQTGELTAGAENPPADFTEILLDLTQESQEETIAPSQKMSPVTDSVGRPVGRDLLAMNTLFDGEIPKRVANHIVKIAFAGEHTMPVTDIESPLIINNEEPLPELKGESLPVHNRGLPPQAPIAIKYANEMLNNLPHDTAPGKYEIMDSYVADKTLYFKVANKHDKLNPFTVSMPIENFQNSASSGMSRGLVLTPLDFDSFGHEKTKLEHYFSKLNIKEIEIVPVPQQKPAGLITEPVQAIITGQNVGQEVTIRSNLSRQALKIRSGNSSGSFETAEGDDGIVEYVASGRQPATTINTSRVLPGGFAVAQNPNQLEGTVSFEKANVSPDQKEASGEEDGVDTFSAMERANDDGKIVRDKINVQPVRFTLPDNIKSAFKPNGQAVTLRIEPEHLGPARLSLAMHNNKLRARVVVENYQAKAAVEASLDRLVDQLSKANIEVDHVKVTVDGEAARNGLFDRRSQWYHRATRFGRLNQGDTADFNKETAVVVPMFGSTSYVGAGGVNLLA